MSELINNRSKRVEDLKMIVRKLHEGASPDAVREELKTIVRECDSGEIAAMEQQLMDEEEIPVEQIMGMCDLHSDVVRDILTERQRDDIKRGHPVDIFRRENEALRLVIRDFQEELKRLSGEGDAGDAGDAGDDCAESYTRLRELFNQLMDIDKHYLRKENLLFSMLEKYGITGPAKVMWGIDDQIRAKLKELGEKIAKTKADDVAGWKIIAKQVAAPALMMVDKMMDKEERILLPMSLETLTAIQWGEIWEQSPRFGWCLIEADGEYRAPKPVEREISDRVKVELKIAGIALDEITEATDRRLAEKIREKQAIDDELGSGKRVVFPTGSLTFQQLKILFEHLPVHLTFVDADDRVCFYSENESRIFARVPAIIGRKVQNCHPPASVHIVEKILDDFKAGREDKADFWLNFNDRFVFVRYQALRNDKNEYVGCLEMTQDLTDARALEGERRILHYDE